MLSHTDTSQCERLLFVLIVVWTSPLRQGGKPRPFIDGLPFDQCSDAPLDHPDHCQCRIIGLMPVGEVVHRIEAQIDDISGVLRALRCADGRFQ